MNATEVESAGLRLSLVTPPPDLAPYVTAYYRTEATSSRPVEDCLPPEWANIRVGRGAVYEAAIGDAPLEQVPEAVISGPTSQVTRLRIADGTFWGIGLLPLGFAKFVGGPASDSADRFRDAAGEPVAERLRPLLNALVRTTGLERGVAVMNEGLRALLPTVLPQHDAIIRAHEAMLCDRSHSVAVLAATVETSTRTLERFCRRYFGFTPQTLLRRQRFLRSLAKFMVDPSMKWVHSLDTQYHDQAQFVREFKHFMLMRPSDYAAMDHPIALTAVRARRAALGEPMQILHRPTHGPAASKRARG